jgi:hypothetical protein
MIMPTVVVDVGATELFQPTLPTLTLSPVVETTPFHACCTLIPVARPNRTVQPFMAAVPLLRTTMSAWNAPCQLLTTRISATQAPVPGGGSVGGGVLPSALTSGWNHRSDIFWSPLALGCTPS